MQNPSCYGSGLIFSDNPFSNTRHLRLHFACGGDGWSSGVHLSSNQKPLGLFVAAAQTQPLPPHIFSTGTDENFRFSGTTKDSIPLDAWTHWKKLGRPKFIVAPMVDHSELPFRLLCRKYGCHAAYTPMLHARVFNENPRYRSREFSTCEEDRPLFVQFCANNPDVLLEAAQRVEPYCDYVDINLGCPQNFAKRGKYGAYLMSNLPLVKSLVERLAKNLSIPVSCKLRIFPGLQDTMNYAKMLEDAGCSLLAVHGRTIDQKDQKTIRANWDAIKAVRNAVSIPVLANGNIRHIDDVWWCLEETGVEGVLSAEAILENPALFAGYRLSGGCVLGNGEIVKDLRLDQGELVVEYLKLCEKYPVSWGIIISHVHKMLGDWFRIHPNVRDEFNAQKSLSFDYLHNMVFRLRELGVASPLCVTHTDLHRLNRNTHHRST
ncbi:tRNA-dihydrouridine(16/17) synthase [NAD(P)(+)]-like [Dorcoceras hygrometricum]|uniref:tRNA-dihydrouridine(16/17) synthase [NAD(P)(+)] n=1 Tax=Dorcoceras hygrometricum TaxID=472368 RepID=A0A2Z7ASS2_9LAMI|nr:tRNA-dihydrouridine(16/17) synthase [NAD(P)(+)]-like [Dorcoceras hygrometricum]